MNNKYVLLYVIFTLLIPVTGQPQQHGSKLVAKVLPNGFSYVIACNDRQTDNATIQLVVKAGYFNENKDQYQAAHVLEHVLLASPQPNLKMSINDYLRSKGLALGRDYNASTGFGETIYTFNVESSDKEVCLRILEYCKSWLKGFSLTEAITESERGAVLSESRLSKANVDSRVTMKYISKMTDGSTMGDLMEEDPVQRVKGLKKSDIESFLKTWYQPNKALLAISGDIDLHWFDVNIEKRFKSLKGKSNGISEVKYPELPDTSKIIEIRDIDKLTTDIEFVFKRKRELTNNLESIREQLLSKLINEMERFRNSLLRGADNSEPIIVAHDQFLMPYTNLRALNAKVSIENIDSFETAIRRTWHRLESLDRYGYSAEEFEMAIKVLRNKFSSDYITNKSIVSTFTQEYLNKDTYQMPEGLEAQVLDILSSVTVRDVNDFVSDYLSHGNYELVITTAMSNADTPTMDSVSEWIREVKELDVPKPKLSSISVKSLSDEICCLENEPPAAVDYFEDKNLGLVQLKLRSGPVIVLRPTPQDPYGNKILMRCFSRRRKISDTDREAFVEKIAPSLIMASGVGTVGEGDLSAISNSTHTSVYPYIGPYFVGCDGVCSSESLETMLQFVYLYITAPKKDSVVFEKWLGDRKKEVQSHVQTDDNLKDYSPLLQEQFFENNRQLSNLTLNDVFSTYTKIFSEIDNLTFIFSGKFEIDDVKSAIIKYVNAIPVNGEVGRDTIEFKSKGGLKYPKSKVIRSGVEKDAAKIELRFMGSFNYSEEAKVAASISRRIINSRLFHRLREQEGGTYFVTTGVRIMRYPQSSFAFQIGFESSMQDKDKLVAATREEVEKIKRNGPTDEEITSARSEEAKYINDRIRTADFWINYLENQYKEQGDIDEIMRYLILINSVDSKAVQDFTRKYLNDENCYLFELAQ